MDGSGSGHKARDGFRGAAQVVTPWQDAEWAWHRHRPAARGLPAEPPTYPLYGLGLRPSCRETRTMS